MKNFNNFCNSFFINLLCYLLIYELSSITANEDRKVYIVYMGQVQSENSLSPHRHLSVLQQVLDSSNAEESLVRSYGRSFNGFAAKLTAEESENLKKLEGVVNVFPSTKFKLHTTRSWDFIGFPESAHKNKHAESDVIIGVIDSGIWPESSSFGDDGIGPPPKKWKGVCKGGKNFTCNNKIIGARSYVGEDARDYDGHGSHTASIAAGRKVDDVSFYGLGQGSARGGAPNARIAVYKACGEEECTVEDVLAGFDDAIADGVDLITISLGKKEVEIIEDILGIAAFHAMQKDILTVQSAGNDGSESSTLNSNAPWILTVAASSMDRRIVDKVVLGNGKTVTGAAVNSFSLSGDKFPLIYGQAASKCKEPDGVSRCLGECMDPNLVKGKIVVCDNPMGHLTSYITGALGGIAFTPIEDDSNVVPFPAVVLESPQYNSLLSYLNTTKAPVGKILKSEAINDTSAPVVVSFSSRGPSKYVPDILKPDISAPGLDILAAFSPRASPSGAKDDKRSVKYNFLSGTSMACPHVAGAAAYVKSVHPDWSPSAIKSALMTTARPMSPSKNPESEFAYGSGHLNPVAAINPGLVYDATKHDYITFLCKIGYNESQIRKISGDKTPFTCSAKSPKDSSPKDVNYPSLAARVDNGGKSFSIKFERTVTNVGIANSTYTVKIETSSIIKFIVEPTSLSFTSLNERKSFTVSVVGEGITAGSMVSASLVWSDGHHTVRSPIVVYG